MNLNKDIHETKWNEFRRNILNGWNKRRNDQLIKVNSARERSISILQERYGYSREQAIYQLDKYYSKAWLG
jgi:3-isopropylmalate dehydratase small subunit